MKRLTCAVLLFCLFNTLQAQTSQTLSSPTPLYFTSTGTGTYNKSVLYHSYTYGYMLELARTSDLLTALPVNFRISARGGYYTPFFIEGASGNIGFNTTAPTSSLHIVSTNSRGMKFSRNGANDFGYEIGNTTFGLYDYTAGEYKWKTVAGDVLLAESSGNVGIGTTTANFKLDVQKSDPGGSLITRIWNNTTNTSGTQTQLLFPVFNGTGGLSIRSMGASSGGFNTGNYDGWMHTGQSGSYLHLSGGNGSTKHMTIKNDGNIGIGTTSPSFKLDVQKNEPGGSLIARLWNNTTNTSGTQTQLILPVFNGAGGLAIRSMGSSSGGFNDGSYDGWMHTGQSGSYLHLSGGNGSAKHMTIKNDGNIGIGTTAPVDKLQVVSTDHDDIFSLKRNSTNQGNTFDFRITTNPNSGSNPLSDRSLTIMATEHAADIALLANPSLNTPQFVMKPNGNIGIGTTSPNNKLDVNGIVGVKGQRLLDDNGSSLLVGDLAGGDGYRALTLRAGDQDRMYINTSGNVGIGTNGPTAKLDVNGTTTIAGLTTLNNSVNISSNGTTTINNPTTLNNDANVNGTMTFGQASSIPAASISHFTNGYLYMRGGDSGTIITDNDGANTVRVADGTNGYVMIETGDGTEKFRVNAQGNVGIGTANPTEKLAVDGTVLAKRARVSIDGSDWPDYVFEEDYELQEINDLEKFVKENKHLPEVPSGKELQETGLDLGNMDATLLKKIEELTLHLIEMNKKQEQLIKEVENLKKQNEALKKGE